MLALVIGDDEFLKETGKGWIAPVTQGAFPTIAANASTINKKKTIFKFIQDETNILIVEVAEELLKGQFIDAIDECYIKELRQGYSEYDNHTLFELLEHVKTKYAALDDHVPRGIKAVFEEPPDLSSRTDPRLLQKAGRMPAAGQGLRAPHHQRGDGEDAAGAHG